MGLRSTGLPFILLLSLSSFSPSNGMSQEARDLLIQSGVRAGLVVHLPCGDGRFTAQLRESEGWVVQGLDPSQEHVDAARATVQSLGLYGPVSIGLWQGQSLPYVDNLVNLLVIEDPESVSPEEIFRVLVPQGVAFVRKDGTWQKTVKPRPEAIDEWTHFLHDASNNAVAQDTVVDVPRSLQWIADPLWARHHDRMASMSGLVSSKGRIFYVFDQGPTSSVELPPKWTLMARDAFNGLLLWQKPMKEWYPHLWPFKSGPAQLPRRIVAVGDTVYVPLGLDEPLSAIDAATGTLLRTYDGSQSTEEILCCDGRLFLLVNPAPSAARSFAPKHRDVTLEKKWTDEEWRWDEKPRNLMAYGADSGEELWMLSSKVMPLSMAADDSRVYFHDGESVVALDRENGQEQWRSSPVKRRSAFGTGFGPTLVVRDKVLLFSGGTQEITALSTETGSVLWTAPHPGSGHGCPQDILVAQGLVWTGAIAGGKDSGVFTGRDLRTGEISREFPPDVDAFWFHHRCYRSKATERFLLPSRTGIEFIDMAQEHWNPNHWVRGGCIYGIMPCNGLVYAPPHDCACYLESKLNGFCALAPERPVQDSEVFDRLTRGPAYGLSQGPMESCLDWVTYRNDTARSGFARVSLGRDVSWDWSADLQGRLTGVVGTLDRVYGVSVDAHALIALDTATGKKVWSHTAGARIDSPPSLYSGLVLFGSSDGMITALRSSDGVLVWRFQAAPSDKRLMCMGQLESLWPVHGSLLVEQGILYAVAGRSMFVDGGLRLLRLDPFTGQLLGETVMDDTDPDTGADLQSKMEILNMPVALSDILASDGTSIYMRSQRFDLKGQRTVLMPTPQDPSDLARDQRGEGRHLICPAGFLDGSGFHRGYWLYGKSFSAGCNWYFKAGQYTPGGRLLVFNDDTVFGYGRKPQYYKWTTPMEFHLFSAPKEAPEVVEAPKETRESWIGVPKSKFLDVTGSPFSVEAWVQSEGENGVIVARGGANHGYALFLQDGCPQFTMRVDGASRGVAGKQRIVGKWTHLQARIGFDETLELRVNNKTVATLKDAGFMTSDPSEGLEIGVDDNTEVGPYAGPSGFEGVLDEIRIVRGTPWTDEKVLLECSFEGEARGGFGMGGSVQVVGVGEVQGHSGQGGRFRNQKGFATPSYVKLHWTREVPIQVRAMVLAGEDLWIAGPPDVVNEEEAFDNYARFRTQRRLTQQTEALEGKRGGCLWRVDARTGQKKSEHRLESPPVWDGMAAFGGRLFVATENGTLLCFNAQEPQ